MPKLLLPEALFIDRVESPIGTMLVFHDSEERLRALDFHDYEPRMRRLFRLHWGQEGSDFVVKNRKTPLAIRAALVPFVCKCDRDPCHSARRQLRTIHYRALLGLLAKTQWGMLGIPRVAYSRAGVDCHQRRLRRRWHRSLRRWIWRCARPPARLSFHRKWIGGAGFHKPGNFMTDFNSESSFTQPSRS